MLDSSIGQYLDLLRAGIYDKKEVLATCAEWENKIEKAYKDNPDKMADEDAVNDYLLNVRRRFW